MDTQQSIKKRIRSIEGTLQITRSMRLVSIAKMQKAREAMRSNRIFLDGCGRLASLAAGCLGDTPHPLLTVADAKSGRSPGSGKPGKPLASGKPVACSLMIVFSGDRGLCGGYNVGVVRYAQAVMDKLGHPVKVVTVGAKAAEAFKRRKEFYPVHSLVGISDAPDFTDADELASYACKIYESGEADEVLLCYTKFTSMLTQTPTVVRLLPIVAGAGVAIGVDSGTGPYDSGLQAASDSGMQAASVSGVQAAPDSGMQAASDSGMQAASVSDEPAFALQHGETASEPGSAELFDGAATFYIAARLYGAMLESAVCEQGARVLSMDGAVRTAGEMIQALNLSYNQARQGVITQEITEIVAGADAVET